MNKRYVKQKKVIGLLLFSFFCLFTLIILFSYLNEKKDMENSLKFLENGKASFANKDYHKAIEYLNKYRAFNKNDYEAYNLLASSYASLGQNELAVTNFKGSLAVNKTNAETYTLLGSFYVKIGEYELAMQSFEKAIKFAKDNASLYNNLAFSYFDNFDIPAYNSSFINHQKLIDINPQNVLDLASLIGSIYANKGDYENAFLYYNISLAIDPDYAYAYGGIGATYFFMHDYDNAIKYLLKSYNLDPNLKFAANFLAFSYLLKDDYESVFKLADESLRHNPDDYDMYSNTGIAYLMKREIEPAIASYKKSIDLTPLKDLDKLSSANAGLGLAYLRNKEYDKAIEHFKIALDYYGKNPVAYGGLAAAYNLLGNISDSNSNFKKMNDIVKGIKKRDRPINAMYMKMLGIIYLEHNLYNEAAKHYLIAVNLNPNNPALYYELGKIYNEIGNEKLIENLGGISIDPYVIGAMPLIRPQ